MSSSTPVAAPRASRSDRSRYDDAIMMVTYITYHGVEYPGRHPRLSSRTCSTGSRRSSTATAAPAPATASTTTTSKASCGATGASGA